MTCIGCRLEGGGGGGVQAPPSWVTAQSTPVFPLVNTLNQSVCDQLLLISQGIFRVFLTPPSDEKSVFI